MTYLLPCGEEKPKSDVEECILFILHKRGLVSTRASIQRVERVEMKEESQSSVVLPAHGPRFIGLSGFTVYWRRSEPAKAVPSISGRLCDASDLQHLRPTKTRLGVQSLTSSKAYMVGILMSMLEQTYLRTPYAR